MGGIYQNMSCRFIMWGCYWNNPSCDKVHWKSAMLIEVKDLVPYKAACYINFEVVSKKNSDSGKVNCSPSDLWKAFAILFYQPPSFYTSKFHAKPNCIYFPCCYWRLLLSSSSSVPKFQAFHNRVQTFSENLEATSKF